MKAQSRRYRICGLLLAATAVFSAATLSARVTPRSDPARMARCTERGRRFSARRSADPAVDDHLGERELRRRDVPGEQVAREELADDGVHGRQARLPDGRCLECRPLLLVQSHDLSQERPEHADSVAARAGGIGYSTRIGTAMPAARSLSASIARATRRS